jgi:hypothetical protein
MKNKTKPKLKDLAGYFFLSVQNKEVNISYGDGYDVSLVIGFSQAMKDDKNLFEIMSRAILTVIESEKKPVKTKKLKK